MLELVNHKIQNEGRGKKNNNNKITSWVVENKKNSRFIVKKNLHIVGPNSIHARQLKRTYQSPFISLAESYNINESKYRE